MSIKLYDDALVAKIQSWLPENTNIHVLKPEDTTRLLQIKADEKNDKPLSLPIISVSRDTTFTLKVNTGRSLSRDGYKVSAIKEGAQTPDNPKVMQLNAIPIELNYQIDIYTYFFKEADAYLREIIFNLINSPKMEIEIPYNNAHIKQVCNLRVSPTITDNSDIQQNIQGQFTRFTIQLRIDDAYLYSVPINTAAKIEDVGFYVVDTNEETHENIEEREIITLDNSKVF